MERMLRTAISTNTMNRRQPLPNNAITRANHCHWLTKTMTMGKIPA